VICIASRENYVKNLIKKKIMKTQKTLKNWGLILMVVMLVIPAGSSYAQNRCRANNCNKISNLTIEQTKQLSDLKTNHLKIMGDLRAERRSTTNESDREEVREQMRNELSKHSTAVSAILTSDQQVQYQQNKNSNAQCFSGKGRKGNGCGNGCGQGRKGKGRNSQING
jgi:hypothetical protein